jgi:L-2-hydroxyglutarate oxidase LhgO
VPVDGGLGVHLTLDLARQARFGPDVEWIDKVDYTLDERRGVSFYADIRRYWPDLPEGSLNPGYAGVRPKLSRAGEPAADFFIEGPAEHGIARMINLFGIESPGPDREPRSGGRSRGTPHLIRLSVRPAPTPWCCRARPA